MSGAPTPDPMDTTKSTHTEYKEGVLQKWANYMSGWQPRWFVLEGGAISYYLSEADKSKGSRGSLSLRDVVISVNSDSDVEFSLYNTSMSFYMRGSSRENRKEWIIALGSAKAQMLVTAVQQSPPLQEEAATLDDEVDTLDDQVAELHTYEDLLRKQAASIVECAGEASKLAAEELAPAAPAPVAAGRRPDNANGGGDGNDGNDDDDDDAGDDGDKIAPLPAPAAPTPAIVSDMHERTMLFKATAAAMIDACAEVLQEQEAVWRRKVGVEKEKRAQLECSLGVLKSQHQELRSTLDAPPSAPSELDPGAAPS